MVLVSSAANTASILSASVSPQATATPDASAFAGAGAETQGIETEPGAYLGCALCDEGIGHRPFCRRNFIARRPFVYRGAVEITRWEEEAA